MTERIQELTRNDVLLSEKNKCVKEITKYELDILVLERANPDAVIARQPLKKDVNGNAISWKDIKPIEMLEKYATEKEGMEVRLGAIETLMKK